MLALGGPALISQLSPAAVPDLTFELLILSTNSPRPWSSPTRSLLKTPVPVQRIFTMMSGPHSEAPLAPMVQDGLLLGLFGNAMSGNIIIILPPP